LRTGSYAPVHFISICLLRPTWK